MDVHSQQCDAASREGGAARLTAEAGRRVVGESPWAWGGVTGLVFSADGAPNNPDPSPNPGPNSNPNPNPSLTLTPTPTAKT